MPWLIGLDLGCFGANSSRKSPPLRGFFPLHIGDLSRLNKKPGRYECSAVVRLNVQVTAELPQSLSHAAKTNSRPARAQLKLFVQGDAFAGIFDLHDDRCCLPDEWLSWLSRFLSDDEYW